MTEALQKMVEAMAREFRNQAQNSDVRDYADPPDGPYPLSYYCIEGIFDLEKVARAGLGAIREPTSEMIYEAHYSALGEDGAGVWRDMVDELLKELPQ